MLAQLDLSYLNFADVQQAAYWVAMHIGTAMNVSDVTSTGIVTFINGTVAQVIV